MRNPDRACIVIDSSPLRYLYTGLGQFSYHLLKELGKLQFNDARLLALVHPRFAKRIPAGINVEHLTWLRRHAPPFLQSRLYPPCRVWHMTTENTRLTGIPHSARMILTIHGLHFLDESPAAEAARELSHVQRLVNRSEIITVVSKFTEGLVHSKLKTGHRRIEVIPNGIAQTAVEARQPAWAPPRKFLFTIGTFFARKNFLSLLPMMERLPEFDLVIAGDTNHDYGREVRAAVEAAHLEARVFIPGEVTEAEKQWLYETGEAYVFPSVSEGFGIPVMESFHHGKPVFCSRHGSLPEVGGPHAFFWDSFDPDHMASLVQVRLGDENRQRMEARKLYAKQFTWAGVAERYQNIYRSLL